MKAGDKVTHKLFGEGEIVEVYTEQNGATYVRIKFKEETKLFQYPLKDTWFSI